MNPDQDREFQARLLGVEMEYTDWRWLAYCGWIGFAVMAVTCAVMVYLWP